MLQQLSALGVFAWPAVVVIALVMFRTSIRAVLSRDDLSVSGPGGLSFSARRAAGALVDAARSRGSATDTTPEDARDQVGTVTEVVRRLGRSPRLLWVDDHPSGNRYERTAVENMGLAVVLSTTTKDAQQKLNRPGAYDVVVSDMARPEDPRAGYTLLEWLRDRGDPTPYVVYGPSNSDAHFDEAVAKGALGSTADPQELVDMIVRALRDVGPRRPWWTGPIGPVRRSRTGPDADRVG